MLNAANEEGVAAFLDGTIRFTAVHRVNEHTFEAVRPAAGDSMSVLRTVPDTKIDQAMETLNSLHASFGEDEK